MFHGGMQSQNGSQLGKFRQFVMPLVNLGGTIFRKLPDEEVNVLVRQRKKLFSWREFRYRIRTVLKSGS